jgi:acetyl-CoA synthetase
VGRADDIIKTSGHMVGPFEVESALMEHPAVAEVGVIGKPEPCSSHLMTSFPISRPGCPTDPISPLALGHVRAPNGYQCFFQEDLRHAYSIAEAIPGRQPRKVH